MFKKTTFVAVAVSILAMGFQVSAAAANGSVDIRDHRTRVEVRDHRTKAKVRNHRVRVEVRDHRTRVEVIDHRTKRPNEVIIVRKVPCHFGAIKLKGLGYKHVKVMDCQTSRYSYRAHKGNGIYAVTMNAYSRSLKIDMIGFAH